MSVFAIDTENNITAFATAEEARQAGEGAITFSSRDELSSASADWAMARFVEIWNVIPGNSKVSKFADRKKAAGRIWKAIQPLARTVATDGQEPVVQPAAEKPTGNRRGANKRKAANAKPTKKAGHAAEKPVGDRANKKAEVIALMKRAKGATLTEIVEATSWQAHYADVRIMPTCAGNPACGAGIAAMESA